MLRVKKQVIGELEKCYSLALLHYQNQDHVLCAAEKQNNCYLINLDGQIEETVWEGPGGVMTMVQVPHTNGQFLATRKFYSPNDSKEASLIICTPRGKNDWEVRTLTPLPFVHRFDILPAGGKNYLIACALKSDHAYKDDWRFPGKVFAAELPADLSSFSAEHPLSLVPIKEGLLKNHGYTRHTAKDGTVSSVIATDNGIYQFSPPQKTGDAWRIEQLTTDAASDAVLLDLDGDGVDELCALAPFHGDVAHIYHKTAHGYQVVWTYPEKLEFLHAIWGGELAGKNTWVIGNRKGERLLLAITYENGAYQTQVLDRGRGAANVMHYVYQKQDILIATNRETNEIARYTLS